MPRDDTQASLWREQVEADNAEFAARKARREAERLRYQGPLGPAPIDRSATAPAGLSTYEWIARRND